MCRHVRYTNGHWGGTWPPLSANGSSDSNFIEFVYPLPHKICLKIISIIDICLFPSLVGMWLGLWRPSVLLTSPNAAAGSDRNRYWRGYMTFMFTHLYTSTFSLLIQQNMVVCLFKILHVYFLLQWRWNVVWLWSRRLARWEGMSKYIWKPPKPKIVHYAWYTIFIVHTVFQVPWFVRLAEVASGLIMWHCPTIVLTWEWGAQNWK